MGCLEPTGFSKTGVRESKWIVLKMGVLSWWLIIGWLGIRLWVLAEGWLQERVIRWSFLGLLLQVPQACQDMGLDVLHSHEPNFQIFHSH